MSLILDALSRAEGEKRSDPGVVDILAPGPRLDPPIRPWPWIIALGAVLLTAVLALLLWYSGDRPADAPAPDSKRANPLSSAAGPLPVASPPKTVIPAPAKPRAQTQTQTAAQAADVAALYAQPKGDVKAAASTPAAARSELTAATESGDVIAPTPSQGKGQGQQEPAPAALQLEDVDLARVLREVRAEAESDQLAPHPAPLLATLSKQFRDGLPTLMYLRHDYNGAGQSTVVINGETLRAGQRSRGVELVEVLPDSVILRFNDSEFRLRALNSWVNL